jgi:hypothetical protein
MSRLYIGDVDLSYVFQPYSSGAPTETRFYVNNVDIGSISDKSVGYCTKHQSICKRL